MAGGGGWRRGTGALTKGPAGEEEAWSRGLARGVASASRRTEEGAPHRPPRYLRSCRGSSQSPLWRGGAAAAAASDRPRPPPWGHPRCHRRGASCCGRPPPPPPSCPPHPSVHCPNGRSPLEIPAVWTGSAPADGSCPGRGCKVVVEGRAKQGSAVQEAAGEKAERGPSAVKAYLGAADAACEAFGPLAAAAPALAA